MKTKDTVYDAIVIGAGQAGLATGYHLQQAGLRFLILEGGDQPGGSWPPGTFPSASVAQRANADKLDA